jgi:L-threonylcarbamoyladenylate synthase
VLVELDGAVAAVLDGGPCRVGVESTIVDLSRMATHGPVLLRPGGMPRAAIEAITGPLAAGTADAPAAPGTLESHYAPRAVVIAVEPADFKMVFTHVLVQAGMDARMRAVERRGRVGVLGPASTIAFAGGTDEVVVRTLPEDVEGMARELYAGLRELDLSGVEVIVAALPPAVGIGEAVGDRLLRAAGPRRTP